MYASPAWWGYTIAALLQVEQLMGCMK